MRRLAVLSLVAMVAVSAGSSRAEWRVDVESETVFAGQQDANVDIIVYWDDFLVFLGIPLVVREVDPGSFWTGLLPYDTGGTNWNHPYQHNVSWDVNWPNGSYFPVVEMRPGDPIIACDPGGDLGYDGVSPDHFIINISSLATLLPAQPDGRPIVTITFDVTGSPGVFEIDTACFSGLSPTIVMYAGVWFPPIDHGPTGTGETSFNKGVITINECSCEGLGDMDGNGLINPLDVIYLVGAIFMSYELPIPTIDGCPVPNGDWNCDGALTPLDLAYIINLVFRTRVVVPCNPCVGGWLPDVTISEDDFYFNPAEVAVGEDVGIWVSIRNVGMETATASQLHIYQGDPEAGGTLLGSGTTIDIPPGGSSGPYGGMFTFDTPGALEIYGVVDYPDLIVEYSEDNNKAFKILNVTTTGMSHEAGVQRMLPTPVELRPR